MVTALSHCFWRTSKKDVWEQLGIPIQTTTMKALKFSPIERHFYLRQHSECQRKFNEKMIRFSDLNIRLKELDKTTANKVMTPLLSLRQVLIISFTGILLIILVCLQRPAVIHRQFGESFCPSLRRH